MFHNIGPRQNKLECFSLPVGLMFASQAGKLLALPANIKLVQEGLPCWNTLAYFSDGGKKCYNFDERLCRIFTGQELKDLD